MSTTFMTYVRSQLNMGFLRKRVTENARRVMDAFNFPKELEIHMHEEGLKYGYCLQFPIAMYLSKDPTTKRFPVRITTGQSAHAFVTDYLNNPDDPRYQDAKDLVYTFNQGQENEVKLVYNTDLVVCRKTSHSVFEPGRSINMFYLFIRITPYVRNCTHPYFTQPLRIGSRYLPSEIAEQIPGGVFGNDNFAELVRASLAYSHPDFYQLFYYRPLGMTREFVNSLVINTDLED